LVTSWKGTRIKGRLENQPFNIPDRHSGIVKFARKRPSIILAGVHGREGRKHDGEILKKLSRQQTRTHASTATPYTNRVPAELGLSPPRRTLDGSYRERRGECWLSPGRTHLAAAAARDPIELRTGRKRLVISPRSDAVNPLANIVRANRRRRSSRQCVELSSPGWRNSATIGPAMTAPLLRQLRQHARAKRPSHFPRRERQEAISSNTPGMTPMFYCVGWIGIKNRNRANRHQSPSGASVAAAGPRTVKLPRGSRRDITWRFHTSEC